MYLMLIPFQSLTLNARLQSKTFKPFSPDSPQFINPIFSQLISLRSIPLLYERSYLTVTQGKEQTDPFSNP